jgi:hypothetical protein
VAPSDARSLPMSDLVFILVTLAFFAVCWLYVRGCERL